jgi:hypothetical protein
MDLPHGFCDRDAEGGVAFHDGDADLDFRDLTVEVPCHEALAQQFHAVHLCLDAASAVVAAPVSPDRAAEVFRCSQRLVSGHRTRGDRLPGLGVSAGRNDGMRPTVGPSRACKHALPGSGWPRGTCAYHRHRLR